MRIVIVGAILVSIAFAMPVIAGESSKMEKIREMMELSGSHEILKSALQENKKQAESMRLQFIDQLEKAFPCMPDGLWEKYDIAYANFNKNTEPTWTIDEAVTYYGKAYGALLTEEEIDEILEFMKSPVGVKSIQASKEAQPKWQAWMQKENQKVLDVAVKDFMAEITLIVEEAKKKNCE